MNVLLVEDDPLQVELARRIFERYAPAVELDVASSLAEARTHLDARLPDVAFVDYGLPDGFGTTLLDEGDLQEQCPVIILTAKGNEAIAVQAMKGGAHDYVVKASDTMMQLPWIAERTVREWTAVRAERLREDQLRQAARMELVGQLAGGVAHDFNNILTVILCGIRSVEARISDRISQSDPAFQDLKDMADAAQRAAALTRQLTAVGSRQLVHPTTVDFNQLLRDMQRMIRSVVRENVAIDYQLEDGLPTLRVDPGQFHRVVLNLVVNANTAMPHGGKMLISTSTVEHAGECRVRIRVADSGGGIHPETLDHIFEPFFTTRPQAGTGLGLAMVYGIVRQAGGTIEVRSAPEEGSTFDVLLPPAELGSKVETHDEREREQTESSPSATVLVAEDDKNVRSFASRILRQAGYTVVETADGPACVDAAEQRARIDLLITDLILPHMNGRSLAEQIRQRHPNLKVLYVSGHHDAMETQDGSSRFLPKPFTPDALLTQARRALGR